MPALCAWHPEGLRESTMATKPEPSPQDRLAASRQAILRYMMSGNEAHDGQRHQTSFDDASDTDPTSSTRSTWQTIMRAVRVWWHHHPAQLALDVARPVLNKYAEEKPLQLLGVAAAAGAVVVLIKPWRLVSFTGLALAALKSSNASGLLLSLLSTHPEALPHDNQN
jgi:hypothetical protein